MNTYLRKPSIAPHENSKTGLRPCLGRGKDQMFLSPDPLNIRICKACKEKRKLQPEIDYQKRLKRDTKWIKELMKL